MLIDDFLPEYDFVETHDIRVRASAKTVFSVIDKVNLCESLVVRGLFFLRGLPNAKLRLRDLQKSRFEVLGIRENKELLLGLAGKFWTIGGEMQKIDSDNFRAFDKKGFAKAVWNFSVNETEGETILTTETRIKCLDIESRRKFNFYWTLIQPFSGLIRNEMLRIIRNRAEIENE